MGNPLEQLESYLRIHSSTDELKEQEDYNKLLTNKSYDKNFSELVEFSYGTAGIVEKLYYYYYHKIAFNYRLGLFDKEVLDVFANKDFEVIKDEEFIEKNKVITTIYKNDALKQIYLLYKTYEDNELKRVNIITFLNPEISNKESFVSQITKYSTPPVSEKHSNIYLISSSNGQFDKTKLEITKTHVDIDKYYNSDFKPIYNKILDKLQKKNDKGLILLHGKMGTGKTTIIKDLVSKVEDKEFIFVPSNLTDSITSPNFISFLLHQKNCVLILEDSDSILMRRDSTSGTSQSVSNLLNIADGILGDGLGIQIIATFNIEVKKLDEALMRKGRLTAMYEFSELEVDKCNNIFKEIGIDFTTKVPMTLADIFNKEDEIGVYKKEETKKIGFN